MHICEGGISRFTTKTSLNNNNESTIRVLDRNKGHSFIYSFPSRNRDGPLKKEVSWLAHVLVKTEACFLLKLMNLHLEPNEINNGWPQANYLGVLVSMARNESQ